MSSFKKLHTRAASDEGRVMIVNGPDGKPTSDWIKVRGQDSEACQRANRNLRRNLMQYLEDHEGDKNARKSDEYHAYAELQQRTVQRALVVAWSFEEECNDANVIELFTNAPYVADQVDDFAGKRSGFVSPLPETFEPSLNTSLTLLSPSPADPSSPADNITGSSQRPLESAIQS